MLKYEVEAKIYALSGKVLLGKATKNDIKEIVQLAAEHGLLGLVKHEFSSITTALSST